MNALIYRFVGLLTENEKCVVCGHTPAKGMAYYRDHMGNVACGHHQVPVCFACTAMCNPATSIDVPNYGTICSECASKSIDPDIAIRLVEYVHRFYKKLGMSFPGHKLQLVSVKEMFGLVSEIWVGVFRPLSDWLTTSLRESIAYVCSEISPKSLLQVLSLMRYFICGNTANISARRLLSARVSAISARIFCSAQ